MNNSNQQASSQISCNTIGILKEPIKLSLNEGHLLPDLYTRLSNHLISVLALSERAEDVPVYAQQATAKLNALLNCEKTLSSEFLCFLSEQLWESNIQPAKTPSRLFSRVFLVCREVVLLAVFLVGGPQVAVARYQEAAERADQV